MTRTNPVTDPKGATEMTTETTCLMNAALDFITNVSCERPATLLLVDHHGEETRGHAARIPTCAVHASAFYRIPTVTVVDGEVVIEGAGLHEGYELVSINEAAGR